MRIIGGKFKNRKLIFPKNFKTRPLKDSVKENIFNILEHSKRINIQIKNSDILDLYSGCGSFGIETLSRGAATVFFVENDKIAMKNLKMNVEDLYLKNLVSLYEKDVVNFIENYKNIKKFDVIFFDPPFSDKKFYLNLIRIKEKDILKKNHIIIIHRESIPKQDSNLNNFRIIEERVYGRSKIYFLKIN